MSYRNIHELKNYHKIVSGKDIKKRMKRIGHELKETNTNSDYLKLKLS